MKLTLLKYSNYYNRFAKMDGSLSDYLQNAESYYQLLNTSFNPGDGVNTQHVINLINSGVALTSFDYDYCVVSDVNDTIVSRWFIIEAARTLSGQYRIDLRRDLIVDTYYDVINAPMFIEKATVGANDIAIYNSEDITFNQIKTDTTPLIGVDGCSWIVGYVAKNATLDEIEFDTKVRSYSTVSSYSDLPYYNKSSIYGQPSVLEYNVYIGGIPASGETRYCFNQYGQPVPITTKTTSNGSTSTFYADTATGRRALYGGFTPISNPTGVDSTLNVSDIVNKLPLGLTPLNNSVKAYRSEATDDILDLLDKNNSYYYCTQENKYYKLHVTSTGKTAFRESATLSRYADVYSNIYTSLHASNDVVSISYPMSNNTCWVYVELPTYSIVYEEVNDPTTTVTVTVDSASLAQRYSNDESAYDIFCMPYKNPFNEDMEIKVNSHTVFPETSMKLATKMTEIWGTNLIDLQLLPYCPYEYVGVYDKATNVADLNQPLLSEGRLYNDACVLYWAKDSTLRTTIALEHPITITEPKVQAQCDMYRLNSPSFNSVFEFNGVKNGGLDFLFINAEFKPYTPFIQVIPNFNGLYGHTFEREQRGLICSGDFSLTQVSNAWTQYQINNATYEQQFNRQIENMEVNNAVQRTMDKISIVSGGITGAGYGATMGTAVGGLGLGTAVGAGIGAAASVGAGIGDAILNEKLRSEALDYTKDMYSYNLQNIQAIPNTITKISSLTPANTFFPTLEYYTCTEEEKQILRDKCKYNGMTVMRIGTISQFLQEDYSYIKGKLIRLETIPEDFHYVNSLAEELNKGVFIK